MFEEQIRWIKRLYSPQEIVPLHEPRLIGREREYLCETVNSSFVSTVGEFVEKFERSLSDYTGAPNVVATNTGTGALQLALHTLGVKSGDIVVTQSFTFVGTVNAILALGAEPYLLDIEKENLGLCPLAFKNFLETKTTMKEGKSFLKETGQRVRVVLPVHVFGFAASVTEILELAKEHGLFMVEDAAEALGSWWVPEDSEASMQHLGLIGDIGVLSFNGNKIITTGGGGALLTKNSDLSNLARHISSTAKLPHPWRYDHDQRGYNFRLPSLNAALGTAQMENLPFFVEKKRELHKTYTQYFNTQGLRLLQAPRYNRSNHWLNVLALEDKSHQEIFLKESHALGVLCRPPWTPAHNLPFLLGCRSDQLTHTEELSQLLVNIPSGVPMSYLQQEDGSAS